MISLPIISIAYICFRFVVWAYYRNAITLAVVKQLFAISFALIFVCFACRVYIFDQPNESSRFLLYLLVGFGCSLLAFRAIEATRDSQWFYDTFCQQLGASGHWAGEATFRKYAMRPIWWIGNQLFLGRSKRRYDSCPRNVGIDTDNHSLLLGMTGSGKSVYVLFNAIASWGGGVFALDPKGELARETLKYRLNRRRNNVYILDPFHTSELRGIHDEYKICYNPLADIDIDSPHAASLISSIAGGCVVQAGKGMESYWSENAQQLLEGFIAHVLSTFPKDKHNLPSVIDALNLITSDSFGNLLADMSQNMVVGGLPARVASILMQAGDREFGALMNEVRRSLKWVTHPLMREHLSKSDISLRELLNSKTSIFICLPIDEMEMSKQIRWMRVLLNLGITVVMKADKPPSKRVLFCIDEFPALGEFRKIVKSFRELRSSNIKMLVCSQGTRELVTLYQDEWYSLMNNSIIQVLALNCEMTATMISKMLGKVRRKRTDGRDEVVDLMGPAEVSRFLGKEAGNQIVIPADGPAMQLNSVHWYRSRHAYNDSTSRKVYRWLKRFFSPK